MNAVILAIGDELTTGQSVDTNSAWLAQRLLAHGILTVMHQTVPDDLPAITGALEQAARGAELVIATGGLGPTDDDLTRQALARAMGVELELDEQALARIHDFFQRRGIPCPPSNRVQALCPRGAALLDNPAGTAPGLRATLGQATVWCLPGVPREMQVMFDRHIQPTLPQHGPCILTTVIHTIGQGESTVGPMLGDLMARRRNPTVGTTAKQGIISVRIRASADDPATAKALLDQTAAQVEQRLGDLVFGRDQTTLAQAVGQLLQRAGRTVVTAESCTGGLVARMLTDPPGASRYFLGGWVTYADAMKRDHLAVPAELLERHGAVSQPVAQAMAQGALQRSGADEALALTGIAGPTGGSDDKPVGTVWIALASRHRPTITQRHHYPYDRHTVRLRAALTALNLLRTCLLADLKDKTGQTPPA